MVSGAGALTSDLQTEARDPAFTVTKGLTLIASCSLLLLFLDDLVQLAGELLRRFFPGIDQFFGVNPDPGCVSKLGAANRGKNPVTAAKGVANYPVFPCNRNKPSTLDAPYSKLKK